MELEKIKSLIRLANNNPNDNEANLAARKACKVLAENDFAALKASSDSRPPSDNPFEDFSAGLWNDIFRRARAQKPRYSPGNPYANTYSRSYDDHKRVYENECAECHVKIQVDQKSYNAYWTCQSCIEKARATREPRQQQRTYYSPYGQQYNAPPYTTPPPRPEKKVRICVKCGSSVETRRITNIFTCDTCEWNSYQNKQKREASSNKKSSIPNCRTCKTAINRYNASVDSWSCECGDGVITAKEAAYRGIKFT